MDRVQKLLEMRINLFGIPTVYSRVQLAKKTEIARFNVVRKLFLWVLNPLGSLKGPLELEPRNPTIQYCKKTFSLGSEPSVNVVKEYF